MYHASFHYTARAPTCQRPVMKNTLIIIHNDVASPLFTHGILCYKLRMAKWYLYILEISNGSLYTGITVDLDRRIRQHNEGKASKCTRVQRPVKLVYSKEFPDRSKASQEEYRIKKMTRIQKIALISGQSSVYTKV